MKTFNDYLEMVIKKDYNFVVYKIIKDDKNRILEPVKGFDTKKEAKDYVAENPEKEFDILDAKGEKV